MVVLCSVVCRVVCCVLWVVVLCCAVLCCVVLSVVVCCSEAGRIIVVFTRGIYQSLFLSEVAHVFIPCSVLASTVFHSCSERLSISSIVRSNCLKGIQETRAECHKD